MAALVMIEGEQPFRVESTQATVIALRMAGFIRSYRADGSQEFTLEGKPVVRIATLGQRSAPPEHDEVCAYDCGAICTWR